MYRYSLLQKGSLPHVFSVAVPEAEQSGKTGIRRRVDLWSLASSCCYEPSLLKGAMTVDFYVDKILWAEAEDFAIVHRVTRIMVEMASFESLHARGLTEMSLSGVPAIQKTIDFVNNESLRAGRHRMEEFKASRLRSGYL